MSVDLKKNKASLLAAWQDVVSDNKPANWVVYGYEPNSNALKVVEKGDGELEEMVDELNSAKIMYAFCRVEDPKTTLNKFVLINWQGEGAPMSRKGICANHVRDITNFFRGAHVTMNARTEDDIDIASILDKVSKSTVSSFNFREKPKPPLQTKPVGSVYKRIKAEKDIDVKARDEFWEKTEAEERKRREEEKKRAQEQSEKFEKDRLAREEKEANEREKRTRERAESIRALREAEKQASHDLSHKEKEKYEQAQKEAEKQYERERKRADAQRKHRLQEAQELVQQRENDPRAVFERHITPAAQRQRKPSEEKVLRDWQARHEHEVEKEPPKVKERTSHPSAEQISPKQPVSPIESSKQLIGLREPSPPRKEPSPPIREPSPPRREPSPTRGETSPHRVASPPKSTAEPTTEPHARNLLTEGLPLRVESPEEEEEQDWEAPPLEEGPVVTEEKEKHLIEEALRTSIGEEEHHHELEQEVFASEQINGSEQEHPGYEAVLEEPPEAEEEEEYDIPYTNVSARALYDYQAADETEITFDPDDIITHVDQIDPGWWRGFGPSGDYGLFPANYVELVE